MLPFGTPFECPGHACVPKMHVVRLYFILRADFVCNTVAPFTVWGQELLITDIPMPQVCP